MNVEPTDDVTVAGIVQKVENGCILVQLPKSSIWIEEADIKTIRPKGNGGRGNGNQDG